MAEELTKLVVDCSLGPDDPKREQVVPLTAAEIRQRDKDIEAANQRRAERESKEAQRDADAEIIRAKAADDPAYAALARTMGISLESPKGKVRSSSKQKGA